jgi:hypothetical protein
MIGNFKKKKKTPSNRLLFPLFPSNQIERKSERGAGIVLTYVPQTFLETKPLESLDSAAILRVLFSCVPSDQNLEKKETGVRYI